MGLVRCGICATSLFKAGILTHLCRDKQHFCLLYFHMHLYEWKPLNFKLNFIEINSLGSNKQYTFTGADYVLSPNRWQAIIWTNVRIVYWLIYASLGLNGLKVSFLLTSIGDTIGEICCTHYLHRPISGHVTGRKIPVKHQMVVLWAFRRINRDTCIWDNKVFVFVSYSYWPATERYNCRENVLRLDILHELSWCWYIFIWKEQCFDFVTLFRTHTCWHTPTAWTLCRVIYRWKHGYSCNVIRFTSVGFSVIVYITNSCTLLVKSM